MGRSRHSAYEKSKIHHSFLLRSPPPAPITDQNVNANCWWKGRNGKHRSGRLSGPKAQDTLLKGDYFRSTLPSMENKANRDSCAAAATTNLDSAAITTHEGDNKVPLMPTSEDIAVITAEANDALNAAANESVAAEAKASTNTTEAICEACTHISDCAAIIQKAAEVIKRIALAETGARVVLPQGPTCKVFPNQSEVSSNPQTGSHN